MITRDGVTATIVPSHPPTVSRWKQRDTQRIQPAISANPGCDGGLRSRDMNGISPGAATGSLGETNGRKPAPCNGSPSRCSPSSERRVVGSTRGHQTTRCGQSELQTTDIQRLKRDFPFRVLRMNASNSILALRCRAAKTTGGSGKSIASRCMASEQRELAL